uniref:2-(3-amino-3-carboxypropyl)histidine synthase subunit 2 n=1 Tax=Kalanchoe fedtschenkoi TaxID=63787 RepID=A0A7N0VLP5_KALFE
MGDFEWCYEIEATAEFISSRNLKRVALQFPDHLLKDSVMLLTSLRSKLQAAACGDVRLFVMADTTYGSCCVDEVGASHVAADCVIHYGHTCRSATSSLPAYFVFGKAELAISPLARALATCAAANSKPVIVLFSLEYAYAMHQLQQQVSPEVRFAQAMPSFTIPGDKEEDEDCRQARYCIGGLVWNIPQGHTVDDYLLFWIGSDGPAFTNVVMTFNGCQIVRYLPDDNRLDTDIVQHSRVLKRRYYLVEKAKDANIVGILVGTLGVAGYLHVINQMKELVAAAGKKAYTFVMGKPNPAKLANFPECDVFIYVSCAETALLDSKEFLSPIITPFEATLAFTGRQWTGEYVMEFGKLITSSFSTSNKKQDQEARFSFIQGGYVEDSDLQEVPRNEEDGKEVLALAQITEKALLLQNKYPNGPSKGLATYAAEFLAARSYTGLDMHNNCSKPETFVVGRTGRAAGYQDETNY